MSIVTLTGNWVSIGGAGIVINLPSPQSIVIDGVTYGVTRIGNQLWTTKDLNLNLNTSDEYHYDGVGYYGEETLNQLIDQYLQANGLSDWHVPTYSEMRTLINFVKSDNNLTTDAETCSYLYAVNGLYNITCNDKYGFSLKTNGVYDISKQDIVNESDIGYGNANLGYIAPYLNGTYRVYLANKGSAAYGEGEANGYMVTIRLVSSVSA